jgi:hypothetical protein
MYDHEESDSFIVPVNLSNKSCTNKPLAETGEGRNEPMENMKQNGVPRTQSRTNAQGCRGCAVTTKRMSPGLLRVRKVAKEGKSIRFTALMHHITPAMLGRSCHALKKQAAPGVDGCTWEKYQEGLAERLEDLHTRIPTPVILHPYPSERFDAKHS